MGEKKRNKQFWKEKQLIRLRIKNYEIGKSIRNQSYVELEQPIHNGYIAEWVLRDDILKRDDAIYFQEALDACKQSVWGRTPDFKYKSKKTKQWVIVNPKTYSIKKEKFELLSPKAQKHFVEDTVKDKKNWRYGYCDKWYRCTLSYELVVKITKHYITHRKEHDNILYQMDAENEKHMYRIAGDDNPWGSNSYKNWFWRKHENTKEKLKSKRDIIEVSKAYLNITSKKDLLDL